MNALMTVPKNGGLTRTTNSATHLPTWSSLFDDFFNRDLTSVFSQDRKSVV